MAEVARKAEHTPMPWASEGNVQRVNDGTGRCDDLWCGNIFPAPAGKYRGEIARIQSADHIGGISIDEAAANAAFIVTACNSHADLVKALEDLDAVLDFSDETLEPVWTFDDLTAVRAAFKQASAALATLTARKAV